MLISSEVNSLVFIGKATFISKQGTFAQTGYSPRYYSPYGVPFYNLPIAVVFNYTFDSGGRDAIFMVYAPYPNKSSLISASRSGNIYTIGVMSQPAGASSFIPTIYCFSSTNSAGNTGNGITVRKSDGSVAFTSNDKILTIKGYYNASFQASNLLSVFYQSFNYGANGPSATSQTISYIPPQNTIINGIAKPIIYMPSYQTSVVRVSGGIAYIYELSGAYNPTSKNLEIEWCCGFFGFLGSGQPNYQTNSRIGFAMVVDGADYD